MLDVKLTKENLMNAILKALKKVTAGLTVALFTTAAVAATSCPTYNGKFLCKNESLEQEMNLKTQVVNGVYQYSLDEATVLADGVTRPVTFQGGVYNMSAVCSEEKVTVKVQFPGGEGDNEACGAEKWDLFYTLNFHPNGENITETHHSDAVCASGKVVPSQDEGSLECTLQK
jgi:hypothetical protein